jgi:hypothetical protein
MTAGGIGGRARNTKTLRRSMFRDTLIACDGDLNATCALPYAPQSSRDGKFPLSNAKFEPWKFRLQSIADAKFSKRHQKVGRL